MGNTNHCEVETLGFRLRSPYECIWANILYFGGRPVFYEPEGILLGECAYLPDFYVPNFGRNGEDVWLEVKGKQLSEKDKAKIKKFADLGNSVYLAGKIPQTDDFASLLNNFENLGYNSDNEVPYYNFFLIDGDYFTAIPAISKRDGLLRLYGDDCNYFRDIDERKTVELFSKVSKMKFDGR